MRRALYELSSAGDSRGTFALHSVGAQLRPVEHFQMDQEFAARALARRQSWTASKSPSKTTPSRTSTSGAGPPPLPAWKPRGRWPWKPSR